MNQRNLLASLVALTLSTSAFAAGEHGGHHGDDSIGEPGKAEDVSRTIDVSMLDNYYEPESISVKAGETVRFRVKNDGALVHEFNIGTADMHEAHQAEMQMMVEHGVIKGDRIDQEMMNMDMGDGHSMKHDDPNSVLMEPGETKEIIWTFTEATDLEFACNVPGHYQAGMYGDIDIE
ncbi:plastocyanin/azurin family copper-binding protein [Marinobacter sp.]|uniref:cupredoxin domain-containing protein n=1 Tax=Marinobacter sp. TaxID=50741 RepID=UPI0034A42BBD